MLHITIIGMISKIKFLYLLLLILPYSIICAHTPTIEKPTTHSQAQGRPSKEKNQIIYIFFFAENQIKILTTEIYN